MPEIDPLESLDYYTLLSVSETESADEIRRAFHRFAAKYHPDRFVAQGADARHVDRAAQIYRRGAEAYRVLTDPRRRKLYDAQRARGGIRFDALEPAPEPARKSPWPIRVKNPLARPFAMKAEQAFKAEDYATAKVNLKMALAKDVGNAEIPALLAEIEKKQATPG